MRMRQLGKGQSVAFFAPPEVDIAIRQYAGKTQMHRIETADILRWCMLGTVADIEHHLPHWATQGRDFIERKAAMDRFQNQELSVDELRNVWEQKEARTLEEMYNFSHHNTRPNRPEFGQIQERLVDLGVQYIAQMDLDEEQEREVNHEVEKERQQEKPPRATPVEHKTDLALPGIINHGILPEQSSLVPLFDLARDIAEWVDGWSSQLLATSDFAYTIKRARGVSPTDFLKPVNWILSVRPAAGRSSVILIALSPNEVNTYLHDIENSSFVTLHMYSPRVTGTMPNSFDDLSFFNIPHTEERLQIDNLVLSQLHLFSGQLYLTSYDAYVKLCNFLGLVTRGVPQGVVVQSDGFVPPRYRRFFPEMVGVCPFEISPVPFLLELVSLRRKGNNFRQTHVGRLLSGRLLFEQDFTGG
jgi:hypothetical protein